MYICDSNVDYSKNRTYWKHNATPIWSINNFLLKTMMLQEIMFVCYTSVLLKEMQVNKHEIF